MAGLFGGPDGAALSAESEMIHSWREVRREELWSKPTEVEGGDLGATVRLAGRVLCRYRDESTHWKNRQTLIVGLVFTKIGSSFWEVTWYTCFYSLSFFFFCFFVSVVQGRRIVFQMYCHNVNSVTPSLRVMIGSKECMNGLYCFCWGFFLLLFYIWYIFYI